MGGEQVNYGASVPISAESMRKAVAVLKQYNVLDTIAGAYFSESLVRKLESGMLYSNDRPDWIQKLEKEWGIR